jgi:hypothetical protein
VAAPEYVPNTLAQQPRRGLPLPPARPWRPQRPGDLGPDQPRGATFGDPGPDQGYALVLERRFDGRLMLTADESEEDAVAGCLGVALRRASRFGRAPIIHDWTVAFTVWGFLGEAPGELVEHRRPRFEGAAHHYWTQRAIAGAVPESTLRLPHTEVVERFPRDWRALLGLA